MNEKRFTETISTGIITDNLTGKEYKCEMRINDEFLMLVNELAKENKKLKHKAKFFQKLAENCNTVHQLENKQLKQVLKNIVHQLDAEIGKDHSLYSIRVIVDGKMFRKIKELIKNA